MKKVYHIGDDIFIAVAFVTFIIGGILALLDIKTLFWNITPRGTIAFSVICLLFSMALSLYDFAHGK